jgi:hypothetical protein
MKMWNGFKGIELPTAYVTTEHSRRDAEIRRIAAIHRPASNVAGTYRAVAKMHHERRDRPNVCGTQHCIPANAAAPDCEPTFLIPNPGRTRQTLAVPELRSQCG